MVVTTRRELLPRLRQILLAEAPLRERDLPPLCSGAPEIMNAGIGGVMDVGCWPRFQWEKIPGAISYLVRVRPEPVNGEVHGAVVCFQRNAESESDTESSI